MSGITPGVAPPPPPRAHPAGRACCAGIGAAGAAPHGNPPGLPAVAYRAGTHAGFRAAMLARLSAPEYPALAGLRTRDPDDPAVALLDAFAVAADVLTFYQERIANEAYLGTATEPEAVAAIAGLIGYAPGPGVAASVDLALTLEPAPDAPGQAAAATTIAAGLRVQSIPGPGQTSQTYETTEPVEARVAWNALRPRRTVPFRPRRFDTVLHLRADAPPLRPGDAVLLVGPGRLGSPGDPRWDLRFVARVEADPAAGRTAVTLDRGLDASAPAADPTTTPEIHALRTRAALFGAAAPSPLALTEAVRAQLGVANAAEWPYAFDGASVPLDNAYPAVVAGGWLVLAGPAARALYRVVAAAETGLAAYAVSGRATRVALDTAQGLGLFDGAAYRGTAAYAGSERLPAAEAPVAEPVYGDAVALDGPLDALPEGRRLILRGRAAAVAAPGPLTLRAPDGATRAVAEGALLAAAAAPVALPGGAGLRWTLRDADGFTGTADLAQPPPFAAAPADAPVIAEAATLLRLEAEDAGHARLRLDRPLANAFDVASLEVLANVARATHGESVSEILGGGDPAVPGQRFALAQRPVTYTRAREGRGAASTLAVEVGGVRWREVPSLLGSGPRDRVFATRLAADGTRSVLFGDGAEGARPPAGQGNVVARYRKGTGLAGLAPAGAVSLLAARPLGLKAAENPMPAAGAQDPERPEEIRRNAPAGALTLGRVVSLQDAEDFARGFAGVAKARADLLWWGGARRVFVTLAGPDGAGVDAETREALQAALRRAAEPGLPVVLGPARPVRARLRMRVAAEPDRAPGAVLEAVGAALAARFGFAARGLGEPLALSAVVAAAVAVPGVVDAQVLRLARDAPPEDADLPHPRLRAGGAVAAAGGAPLGAELLTLEPAPLLEAAAP